MKPHEVVLRYDAETRTVLHGGMPVAVGVDAEWGALLASTTGMVRALMEVRDAMLMKTLDEEDAVEVMERALRKAEVLT